ncbi:hypothetical protein GCM10017668_04740 [Streptomyces tuirus]|uniref:Uncharacterized protein n=1 Tax=Streptomyces tuirus TaxID=68278 RepID=A0A7G1N7D7_9ACTN|nr:hypothetical protein GCM10017668_04740 [Streptomyces tuirus]
MPAAVAATPATATVIRSELMNVAATVPPPKPSGINHQLYQATGARAAGGGVASSICILRSNTNEQGGVLDRTHEYAPRVDWTRSRQLAAPIGTLSGLDPKGSIAATCWT